MTRPKYPTEFTPFKLYGKCLKCTDCRIAEDYQAVEMVDVSEFGEPPGTSMVLGAGPAHEWMQRTCKNCGYWWAEYCADYIPDE